MEEVHDEALDVAAVVVLGGREGAVFGWWFWVWKGGVRGYVGLSGAELS